MSNSYFIKRLFFFRIRRFPEIKKIINFTLYLHSSGGGNLVLRHSVPHFPPNSEGINKWRVFLFFTRSYISTPLFLKTFLIMYSKNNEIERLT